MATNIKMKKIDHISINTVNLEETINFYTEILNFKESRRLQLNDCEAVYLKIDEDTKLEIFCFRNPISEFKKGQLNQGFRHIAFYEENIEELYSFIKKTGISIDMDLCDMPLIGKRGFIIHDPNGVYIEICKDITRK